MNASDRPEPTEPHEPKQVSARDDLHAPIVFGEDAPDLNIVVEGSSGTAPAGESQESVPEVSGFVPAEAASGEDEGASLQTGRSVFGTDDRVRVPDTTRIPWRQVCCLQIKFPMGVRIGTGTLIGPRAVGTAAHCVYDHWLGGKAEEIVVTPGRNGQSSGGPFGSAVSRLFVAAQGWTRQDARAPVARRVISPYDYAVIVLPTDLGTKPGWMAFASLARGELQNRRVNHVGYALDRDFQGTTQWWNANSIAGVDQDRLFYFLDTADGESGGPVYVYEPATEQRILVGIHTSFTGKHTSAVRISPQVRANLGAWRDLAR